MHELRNTTLIQAKRYGVTKEEIIEWAQEYGWEYVRTVHYGKPVYRNCFDHIIVRDTDKDSMTYGDETEVEIFFGECPECGERAVVYGWYGASPSTCKCEVIDMGC